MEEMIRQIRAASQIGLYYVALLGALSLPDICGALASNDGKATPSKYKAWLRGNVPEQASGADLIYGLRCSLLHQGRAHPHGSGFQIAFVQPRPQARVHNAVTNMTGEPVLWLDIPFFVDEVTRGVESWLKQYGDTETVTRNMEKFVRVRPEGLPPHVVGSPVIA